MSISQFNQYLTTKCSYREVSEYKNVPIQLLTAFRETFGSTMRIRYRGKRNEFKRLDGRTKKQCNQDCIKARADRFAAYVVDYKRYSNIIEREKNTMKNLTIVINGLEYVAKEPQPDFTTDELLQRISDLVVENDQKANIIKSLEEAVSELEEENHENDKIINDLRSTLDDISYLVNRVV
jgi:predicted RNase H-like nuclease (RuvC/YqgF family)